MKRQTREDKIYEELHDIKFDINDKVDDLINVKWDSPTLKKEIANLLDKGFKLHDELEKLEKKK